MAEVPPSEHASSVLALIQNPPPNFHTVRKTDPSALVAYADAEVAELWIMLGFGRLNAWFGPSPIEWLRLHIDRIVDCYRYQETSGGPPTPNAQHKHLNQVRRRAQQLLEALGDGGVMDHMVNVEPAGLRSMLVELRNGCDQQIERITPLVTPKKKQRRSQGDALDQVIYGLFSTHCQVLKQPPHLYSRDPSDNTYSGQLVDLVEHVCRMIGDDVAKTTIGNHIANLSSEGKLDCPY